MSVSSLCECCRLLGLRPHDARDFTRVLRAVIQSQTHQCTLDVLIDVSDRRTLRSLLGRAGGAPARSIGLAEWLESQRFVPHDHPGLEAVRQLLPPLIDVARANVLPDQAMKDAVVGLTPQISEGATRDRREPATPTHEAFAMFCGDLDQEGLSRLFHVVSKTVNDGVTAIDLLLQSAGGPIGNGICLYNWLRALPVRVTAYNAGAVRSSAVVAYLGARHRKVSARATFTLHPATLSPRSASAGTLRALADSVRTEADGMERLLRRHLTLTDDEWTAARETELILSAERATAVGLADEISEFTPPPGARFYAI